MDRRRSAVIAAALLLTGCTPTQASIDGYPVGAVATCQTGCTREVAAAVHWLDRTTPAHPVVDRIELHVPDYRTADGSPLLAVRSSGSMYIAVFVFADGSRGAVQVGCGIGVDPEPCFTSPPGIGSSITIETP